MRAVSEFHWLASVLGGFFRALTLMVEWQELRPAHETSATFCTGSFGVQIH